MALTILVVEDQPSFARGMARLLQRDGHRVEHVPDGCRALAYLRTHPADVIICDLHMPGMDGPLFYAQLLQDAPHLRQWVLFVTGGTLEPQFQAFLTQCEQPWLAKPFSAARLRATIAQMLQARGAEAPLAPEEL